MKIRTREPITFKTVTGSVQVPVARVVKVDREIGRGLVSQGKAESEPIPYFVKEFNQTIMLCNSLEAVERVESEGELLAFTPYQLYLLCNKKSEEIEAVLETKNIFHGTVILAGTTIKRSDIDADAKPQTPTRTNSEESENNDMKMSKLFPSNYLSQDDLEESRSFTIEKVILGIVENEDGKKEKPLLFFEGDEKPLILNKTNGEILTEVFGDDSDEWIGQTIELYIDPTIRFGNKKVGGIRVRIPNTPKTETAPF